MPKNPGKPRDERARPTEKKSRTRKDRQKGEARGAASFEQLLLSFRDQAIKGIEQWCIAQGEVPHPRMTDAWDIFLESMLQCPNFDPQCEVNEVDEQAHEANLTQALFGKAPEDQAAIGEALAQLQRFADSLEQPEEWFGQLSIFNDLK